MNLAEELQEKVNVYHTVDILPGDGVFEVPQSAVVTWGIMVLLVVASIIFTRNLQIVPKGKQALLESFMEMIYNMFHNTMGDRGKKYIPYLTTVLLYLGIANMTGLFGIAPPTKDLNVTAGLALMTIVLVQYAGIRERGVGGWLKSYTEPVAIITPLKIMEIGIKPLSLCMRLFGNVLGAYIIMELIIHVIPAVIPLAASAYFDIFDGLLQAYVFCFLSSLYIHEAIEEEE